MPLLRDPGALVRRALAAPAAAQAHCIRMSLGKFQAESTMLWTISTLCVLLTLLALSFYDWPYNRDITTYATLAQELVYDKRLYVDVWDFKPPAIFATYMIAQYMIESKPIQIFLLHLCASIVIMVILIRSGREAGFGDAAGLLSGLLWLVLSNDLALQMHEPNTEIFINLCVVTAFFLFLSLHGRSLLLIPILIGTLFAIACLFKTVAIVMAVMALTYLILPPPDCNRSIALAQVAVMAASAALCLAAVFGYFALTGRFPVFWEVLVHAGADYAATAWQGVLNRLGRSSIGGARLWLGAAVAVFPWCLVALLAWLDRDRRRPWVLLGTYAFAALTAVILPGQFYAHYFQLLVPPLCLGLGWLTALLAQKGRGILAAAGPAIAGLCLVGLVAYEAPSYWLPPEVILRGTYQELYLETQKLGRRLGDVLHEDESLYQWGEESGLYWYSGKRPPASVLRWPLVSGPQAERLTRQTLDALVARPPDLIVVVNRLLERGESHPVYEWIRSGYVPLQPRDAHERQFFTFFVAPDAPPELVRRVVGKPSGEMR